MSEPVDVGIMVALSEEFEELHNQVGEWKPIQVHGQDYYRFGRSGYRCVATLIGDMNPVPCADRTKDLIEVWQPETVVLVGISGSLNSDIKVGDIVVAEEVCGYQESGAVVDNQTSFEWVPGGKHHRASPELIKQVKNLKFKNQAIFKQWIAQCSKKLNELLNSENRQDLINKKIINDPKKINIEFGHIASGTTVVKSQVFQERYLKPIDRKLLAVDMESYGFLNTTGSKDEHEREKTLILRGISDSGDKQKAELEKIEDRALRRYAMHNALQLLWAFLQMDFLPRKESQELQDNLKKIAQSLTDGKLVFFLGSGINYSPDNSNTANLPPSDLTIAKKLSENHSNKIDLSGFPCEFCPVNHENRPENQQQPCPIKQKIESVSSTTPINKESLIDEQKLTDAKRAIQCWAQYILTQYPQGSRDLGSKTLSAKLREIFKVPTDYQPNNMPTDYQPNNMQKFLADLAYNIYEKKMPRPLIIATSNYDYGLEKAFEDKQLRIDVISYITEGINSGNFCYGNYTPNPNYEENNSRFNVSSEGSLFKKLLRNIPLKSSEKPDREEIVGKIIKLYGGVLYKSNQTEYESFTIAESHRINYLKQQETGQILPKMTEKLMNSDMLFIGYSANDTDLLRILQRLLPERFYPSYLSEENKGKPRGWLIHQSKTSAINEKYWRRQNVTHIQCGWEDFIQKFKITLKDKNSFKFSE